VRVPPTLPADELVGVLRGRRAHLAIVVDAEDRAIGLLTIQDVLEALVGAGRDAPR
jgi:CBS domain containing-hemolysin-like protein